MTYALLTIPFFIATALVTAWSAWKRPGIARRLRWSTLAALALVALTAVFDNAMIAAGLFTYPEHLLSGISIGLAPIEDFAYPLCAAYLLPSVYTLVAREEVA